MKKNIIIASSLVAGIALIIFGGTYLISFHTVTVSLKAPNITGTVGEVGSYKQPTELSKTTDLKLRDGSYVFIPEGSVYATDPIAFTVAGKDTTVEINPAYSQQHLAELLQPELQVVTSLITQKYGNLLTGYTLSDGVLLNRGEWYGTTIVGDRTPDGGSGDVYHLVLQKEGDSWKLATAPEIVLTTHSYPKVPKYILTTVNDL